MTLGLKVKARYEDKVLKPLEALDLEEGEELEMREAMRLTTIQSGSKVFIDSNIFTYHFSGHSVFGETCREFLKTVGRGEYEVM
jgi:predicted DNA-binding antitoxin AbrB/MazE fold protein